MRERCTFNWLDNYEVKTFLQTWKFFLACGLLKILVGSNSKKERITITVVSEKKLRSLLFVQNFSQFRLLASFFFLFCFLSFLSTYLSIFKNSSTLVLLPLLTSSIFRNSNLPGLTRLRKMCFCLVACLRVFSDSLIRRKGASEPHPSAFPLCGKRRVLSTLILASF